MTYKHTNAKKDLSREKPNKILKTNNFYMQMESCELDIIKSEAGEALEPSPGFYVL